MVAALTASSLEAVSPLKVAVPFTAVTGFAPPILHVPPPVGFAVTLDVFVVNVLLPASCITITGCEANVLPLVVGAAG